MTYTEKRLKFEEEVAKELGYVSALFMTQECKGTEIVMPTKELKEVVDRIGLYAFESIQQARAEERARVAIGMIEIHDRVSEEWSDVEYRSNYMSTLLSSLGKPLTDKELIEEKVKDE